MGFSPIPQFVANVLEYPENRPDTVNIGNIRKGTIVRTRLGICVRKKRYQSLEEAALAGNNGPLRLRPYRCRLCRQYHLTSRTKGMFVGRKSDKAAP